MCYHRGSEAELLRSEGKGGPLKLKVILHLKVEQQLQDYTARTVSGKI